MNVSPEHRDGLFHAKMPLEERLADEARFLKTWLENPLGTGAVSPSGRALAKAMARRIDPTRTGPVLELGPGTGPVTEALIGRGIAPERLVLVEFDPHFCKLLARRYPRSRVVQGDAYRLAETLRGYLDVPASAVVSSLPLLTRPERQRLALLQQAFDLLEPGAVFIQFTYGIASPMPRRHGFRPAFEAEASAPVWLNLPPARVWVYREAAAAAAVRDKGPEPEFRLKLKTGTELLGEELREQGDKLRLGLKLRAEMVKNGLNRKTSPKERERPGRLFCPDPGAGRTRAGAPRAVSSRPDRR